MSEPILVCYWDCENNKEDSMVIWGCKTAQEAVNLFRHGRKKGTYKVMSVWAALDEWQVEGSEIYL